MQGTHCTSHIVPSMCGYVIVNYIELCKKYMSTMCLKIIQTNT